MALINCPECKKEMSDRAAICPHCGFPIIEGRPGTPTFAVQEMKNRGTAILLSLLLGSIGAHKFYLDKPGVGFLYLIFCWTFLPAIFGLIEAIQYASMTNETFQQKYRDKKL